MSYDHHTYNGKFLMASKTQEFFEAKTVMTLEKAIDGILWPYAVCVHREIDLLLNIGIELQKHLTKGFAPSIDSSIHQYVFTIKKLKGAF